NLDIRITAYTIIPLNLILLANHGIYLELLKRLFGRKLFNLEWLRSLFRRSLKFPVSFPTAGWETIPDDETIEEEQIEEFLQQNGYLPVDIGDILLSRYQVVGKLGWGITSTVWLARDLEMNDYMALKMFSHDMLPSEESTYYDKIKQGNQQHLGSGRVRTKIAEFEFTRLEIFKHLVILQEPLGESLLDIQNRSVGERLDKLYIQSTIYQMLLALDYMHTECILIHGGLTDTSRLRLNTLKQEELISPISSIALGHLSQHPSWLGDLGSAQPGDVPRNSQPLQPALYRSPEVILEKEWNYPVDIWNLGVWAVDCFPLEEDHDAYTTSAHLAYITGLLGPPPPDFIEPDTISAKYFDKDGNWIVEDCEVHPTSFEDLEKHLEGEDKEMFLDLMKGMITWRPEDRKTPRELIEHPWLQGIFWPPGCYKPTE
ncbi:uncharacterized protein N7487_003355, partial [Penicillium crustosum]|uniref:uncharacterized protein n=1 Tax=Penicillium crustosum TaxID=36656 RepID=UPI00238B0CEF